MIRRSPIRRSDGKELEYEETYADVGMVVGINAAAAEVVGAAMAMGVSCDDCRWCKVA